jgi:hypothetical protein
MTGEELLQKLRSGHECSVAIMKHERWPRCNPWSEKIAWKLNTGEQVAASAVSHLRKRGLVVISEGVLFRYVRLVENNDSVPLHGRGSAPVVR